MASGASPEDPELAALEALADEIEGDSHEWPEGGGEGAGGGAKCPAAAGPWVRDCWEQATDLNSGQPYWFNRATGVSQWTPPPGWTAGGAAHEQAAAVAGEAGGAQGPPPQQQPAWNGPHADDPSGDHQPGLYYRDAQGQLQGPFIVEQLREWRAMLPMDLPILQLQPVGAAGGSTGGKDGRSAGQADGMRDGADAISAGAARSGEEAGPGQSSAEGEAAQEEAGRVGQQWWSVSELACVLGDDELLAWWRMESPEQAAWPGSAPPAAAYEAERARGSGQSLAEAVLYGLPAHDEAVAVARVAASSGRSIQEVLEWSRGGDYAATAYRVAARGRIQAPGATESLYAEAASWADPAQLEQQLARAAERRKRALTGEELRQVKQRKQEMKEKKLRGWLFT